MSERIAILGKVVAVKPRTGLPAATLLPLTEVSSEGNRWEAPYDEAARRSNFPNAGRISWIEPPPQAVPGTYWVFRTEYQPSYDKDPTDAHRDKYRVIREQFGKPWYESAQEVIDIDVLGGEPAGRERVTKIGIPLGACAQTAFYLKWGALVTPAPVRFIQVDTCLWVVDPAECKQSMEWREPQNLDGIFQCPDGSMRSFYLPGVAPVGTRVTRDWASDDEVFRHVLARLRKWDPDYGKAVDISDRAIARISAILASSVTDAQSLEYHRHRVDRTKNYIARAQASAELMECAKEVLAHGPLADEIDRQRDLLLSAIRQEVEETVAAEFSAKRAELESIGRKVASRLDDVARLDRELAEKRSALEARVEELEAEIEQRVRRAMERPEAILADVALARVFARAAGTSRSAGSPTPRGSDPTMPAAPAVADERELITSLERSFLVHEAPMSLVRPLHASFLAGLVPLVAGPLSFDTLRAYAQGVCSADVHCVPISPGCLEPLDLFGRIDPASGQFVPSPGDLADYLAQARGRTRLSLVVLDGVTRAGADSYLLPLLDCVYDAARGVPPRTLDLIPVGTLTFSGRDPGLRKFSWPPNVLLAGIVRQGTSSFAPPPEVWARASFLVPGACSRSTVRPESIHPDAWASQRQSVPATCVVLDMWRRWQATRQSLTLTEFTQFWSAPSAPKVDGWVRDAFLRVFASLRGCSDSPADAIAGAVALTLLPVLRSDRAALEAAWDAERCPYPDARTACEHAMAWLG